MVCVPMMHESVMHVCMMYISMIFDPGTCIYVCVMYISIIPENEKPAYLPKMSSARSCVSVAQWIAKLPFHFT